MAREVVARHKIASVTSGIDVGGNRSLISNIYLVALAPSADDVEAAIKEKFRAVVSFALYAGVNAFYATPGELSLRLAAAFGAFKAALLAGMKLASIYEVLEAKADECTIDVVTVSEWEDGIRLVLKIDDPFVSTYAYVREWLERSLGGDAGKIVGHAMKIWIDISNRLKIDFDLQLDIPQLPTVAELEQYAADLLEKAKAEAEKVPVFAIAAVGLSVANAKVQPLVEHLDQTAKDFLERPIDTLVRAPDLYLETIKLAADASIGAAIAASGATAQVIMDHAREGVKAVLNAVGIDPPHIDIEAPHVDIGPVHIDTGHIDVLPHVDTGHIDLLPHVDTGHIDVVPHVDTGHIDVVPHIDTGHVDIVPHIDW